MCGILQMMPKSRPKQTTDNENAELSKSVSQLHEEVRLLRMAIDELRDDVVWVARQVLNAGHQAAPAEVSLRPVDPLAPDADFRQPLSPREADEDRESVEYCCAAPRLTWNGDPDTPGIACENCGYIVAENGSVVIWRGEEEPGPQPTRPDQQARLFD
jgi:hypothetical protein